MSRQIDLALQSHGLPRLQRSSWVEVDIEVLTTNALSLAAMVSPAALAPVVKADGYGHGLEIAARCAVAAGSEWLCVADSAEAIQLRADGYRGRVLVLYPVPSSMWLEMADTGVDLTVGGVEEARAMARSVVTDRPLGVHVEIDTGMTRGGVRVDEVVDAAGALTSGPGVELAGVWTHLSAPEDQEVTKSQLDHFAVGLDSLETAGIEPGVVHAAASGGLLASDTSWHDLVRPGLAFYGLHPDAGDPLPSSVAPALSVRAQPVRVLEVPSGTRVGYAGTWTAENRSVIATLPIGYADGWSRSSSPGTFAIVKGRRAPIVGRISSDSLTVDITGIQGAGPASEFTLLGRDGAEIITADEVAAVRGTISWEVLQQLGARLSRVYTVGSEPIALRPESSVEIMVGEGASVPHY
ncbi:MAG TPA: alanine racemase [Acidimicrobiia bacterium]|nr:alanine racemase [Acidimicrobiia bacterium]